jgi:gamma-glutamyltranspeptidase/glutathione hydrolase
MKYFIAFILCFNFLLSSCTSKPNKDENSYYQVELPQEKSRNQYDAIGSHFMVSTQGPLSTQAGIEILKKGGNLFDAFTAISFAVGVERPQSTGMGGGGFVLFYSAKEKKVYAFDFREMAPRKASSRMFLNADGSLDPQKSVVGALAIATPGHVAGVLEIQKKYGKLKLKDVLAPAIHLAESGIVVYPALHQALISEQTVLSGFPSTQAIFLDPENKPWPVGHILIQKDLAESLKEIANQGSKAFYQGTIAQKIASTVAKYNGVLSAEDLKRYRPRWRTPVKTNFHEFEVYSQPLPSAGGVQVIQILNTLENAQLKESGPQSPRSIHFTASAMQQSFYDRAQALGDPDFAKIPVEKFISKKYGDQILKSIQENKAKHENDVILKKESPETTHFTLMDSEGNIITSTQTINGYFGSGLVAEGTGIMLNNEMDDFATQVGASNLYGAIGGEKNLIQPFKRPLSSMSPTLVLQNGKPYLALGTPSGTRIVSCVALTLLNVLEYDLPLWEAVTLTRYHHQWKKDVLQIESSSFPSATLLSLKNMGYELMEKDLGCRIQAVQKKGELIRGVSDPREEGASLGL